MEKVEGDALQRTRSWDCHGLTAHASALGTLPRTIGSIPKPALLASTTLPPAADIHSPRHASPVTSTRTSHGNSSRMTKTDGPYPCPSRMGRVHHRRLLCTLIQPVLPLPPVDSRNITTAFLQDYNFERDRKGHSKIL